MANTNIDKDWKCCEKCGSDDNFWIDKMGRYRHTKYCGKCVIEETTCEVCGKKLNKDGVCDDCGLPSKEGFLKALEQASGQESK